MKNLGLRIKNARQSAGFTQESLAEAVGVSRTAVARWEHGDTDPKLQNIVCISQLVGVSTDYLLGINPCCTNTVANLSDEAYIALENLISEVQKQKK